MQIYSKKTLEFLLKNAMTWQENLGKNAQRKNG